MDSGKQTLRNSCETLRKDIEAKEKTIRKLELYASTLQKRTNELEKVVGSEKGRRLLAEEKLAPLKSSLDALTAERGIWLRKLKRAGVDI